MFFAKFMPTKSMPNGKKQDIQDIHVFFDFAPACLSAAYLGRRV